jgi:hypothetical protein
MRYLCALLLTLLLVGPASAQIERTVSEVTGAVRLTSVEMRPLISLSSYPGHASFRAEWEDSPQESATWRLSFYGFVDSTTGMNAATNVRIQADGAPVSVTRVASTARQLDQSVVEIKRVNLPRSAFETVATAENVTVAIGPARFELTLPLRKDLRLILERVESEPEQSTASTDTDSLSDS